MALVSFYCREGVQKFTHDHITKKVVELGLSPELCLRVHMFNYSGEGQRKDKRRKKEGTKNNRKRWKWREEVTR
jgi:hypothetical protein